MLEIFNFLTTDGLILLFQIVRAHSQLSQYEARYRSRLKAQNLMYIKQIMFILSNLIKSLGGRYIIVLTSSQPVESISGKVQIKIEILNRFCLFFLT